MNLVLPPFTDWLGLRGNHLSGTLASEIGLLSNLAFFIVGYNALSGTIPSEIGQATSMLEWDAWANNFRGTIPEEIYDSLNLMYALILGTNSLSGTISTSIGGLRQLSFLILRDNPNLTGTLPTEISKLSLLRRLDVDGTGMIGPVPDEVCSQRGEVYLASFRADCLPLASQNDTVPMFCPQRCCSKCCDRETGDCVSTGH